MARETANASINAHTQLFGIFGKPVRHSLSPEIHNEAFRKTGLNAAYLAFEIEKENLRFAFEAVRSLGIRGVNVTVPYKEAALEFVDEVPEDIDRTIGAVNTIVNKQGRLFGYNTDGPGFLWALKEDLQFEPSEKTCLVLGAGGSGRAVAFYLAHADADRIVLYNRTPERAAGLRTYLAPFFPDTEIEAVDSPEAVREERVDLVVNATACGLRDSDPAPMELSALKHPAAVYDLIYAPARTALLREAAKLGLPHAGGSGMLAAQAALSFEMWTGKREGIRETMLETLDRCRTS